MPGISFRAAGITALLAAALYQTFLRDIIPKTGIGRSPQRIADFPYQCRRITHEALQACEDMWLDETNRQLYLACSNVIARKKWLPQAAHLNESARPTKDAIFVLDIDKPVGDSYEMRRLTTPAFYGLAGEGELHAFAVNGRETSGNSKVELYLVNNKPSLSDGDSAVGNLADNARTGANTTIELFEVKPGSSSMQHIRTFVDPLIVSPNNVAPIPDGSGFYVSNDHGLHKSGLKYALSPFLFTGNIVHCTNPSRGSSTPPVCKVVATGISYPNGLIVPPHDPTTLYVPITGLSKGISIFNIHPDGHVSKIHDLVVPYSLDNLSPSADGSIYAAAFPKPGEVLKAFRDPKTLDPDTATADRVSPPATVLKISKQRNLVNDGHEVTWTWEKVIEDAEGQVLPLTTVAVKDPKTGRLFMSGESAPESQPYDNNDG